MKNLVKILCGLSIISLAAVACNKTVEEEVVLDAPISTKHRVKVTASYAENTRTVMLNSGDQTKWTNSDIANMHFFENGVAPDVLNVTLGKETPQSEDNTMLTIDAEFGESNESTYVYTSILASNLDADKNAHLNNEQGIYSETFDPSADILVALPQEFDATQFYDPQSNLTFQFQMRYKRVVAINKIKIKGLTENDVISSVTISSNKPILGSYSMGDDEWTPGGYELTLSAVENHSIIVPESGEVSLWFITAPVEGARLSIYVVTNNHQYEKDFTKTITFEANTVTSFATTVSGCEVEVTTGSNDFIRVESSDGGLKPGDYVMVAKGSEDINYIFTGFSNTSTIYGLGSSVTIDETNHKISNENVSENSILSIEEATVTEGAYVIKRENDYFYWTSGNSLSSSSTESANSNWNISISDGNAIITNAQSSTRQIWWNVSSPRFACYENKTNGNQYTYTQLYKKDEGGISKSPLATPEISLASNSTLNGIIVTWNDVNKAVNYTVSCTNQESKTIAQGVQTAEFTNLTPGTYTVTVTANPSNASRNTASTSESASLEIKMRTIAAIKNGLTSSNQNFEADLTDVIVTGKYSNGAFIQDNSGGIFVYNADDTFVVGQKFTGTITGTRKTYNGQSQLSNIGFGTDVTWVAADLPLETVSLSDLLANMSSYEGKRVKICKVKTTGILNTTNSASCTVSQDEQTIKVQARVARSSSISSGTYIDVIGFPYVFSSTNTIDVTVAEAINESTMSWQVKSFVVKNQPTKLTYTEGEKFDPSGLVITVTDEDADYNSITRTRDVAYENNESDFSFDPGLNDELATTDESVEITYAEKTASQAITVHEVGYQPSTRSYTLTLSATEMKILDSSQSSTYNKYKGDQTFTAVADDDPTVTMDVTVNVANVMTSSTYLQLRKSGDGAGTLYNKTNLGTITSITYGEKDSNSNNIASSFIGSQEQPTSNGSGGFFKVVNGSTVSYVTITIKFEI